MISKMLLMRFGKKHWPSSRDCGLLGVPVTGLQCDRAVCWAPSTVESSAGPLLVCQGRDSVVAVYWTLQPNVEYPSVVSCGKQRARASQLPPCCPPWPVREELGASRAWRRIWTFRGWGAPWIETKWRAGCLGGKLLSATELVPCLLQLELVRVVGAMWGAAGALLPGALWVGRGGRVPSLKFSSAGPRRTWLERCQSFRFFTT